MECFWVHPFFLFCTHFWQISIFLTHISIATVTNIVNIAQIVYLIYILRMIYIVYFVLSSLWLSITIREKLGRQKIQINSYFSFLSFWGATLTALSPRNHCRRSTESTLRHECSPTAQPEPLVHLAKEGNLKSERLHFQEIAFFCKLKTFTFWDFAQPIFLVFCFRIYFAKKKSFKEGISRHEKEKCIATVAL